MSINVKDKTLQKELMLLIIANGFLSQAMMIDDYKDTMIKDNDSIQTINLKRILQDIAKKSRIFRSRLTEITEKANTLFDELSDSVKDEIKHPKPQNRFKKKCRLNENQDLEVNGVMFAISLMMLHKEMINKKLFLQYKLIEEVYLELNTNTTKSYLNARILARRYFERLEE